MARRAELLAGAREDLASGELAPTGVTTPADEATVVRGRRLPARILRNANAGWGAAMVAVAVAVALLAPLVAPQDPLEITGERLLSPSWSHLMGTDGLGRDIFSRVVYGARTSIGYAALAAVLVMTIGVLVGTVAGYYGGLVDAVLMRLVDLILALPGLVVSFAIAGLFEPSLLAVLVGLVSVWWVGWARIVRSLVLAEREKSYVQASLAVGASGRRVILRHILPNVGPSVIVLLAIRMGRLILAIAGLSFLGLGAQPPTPEWGAMINESRAYFPSYPHLMLAPGLAISFVVMGLNLLGDGLRDLLDPRISSTPGPM